MNSDVEMRCAAIVGLGRRRKFYLGAVQGLKQRLVAYARGAFGFSGDASDADREKTSARALALVEALIAGKPAAEKDAEIAEAIIDEALAVHIGLEQLTGRRKDVERDMVKVVRALPVHEWAKGVRGLGDIGLAVVVAEAGDLAKYPHYQMLWKRLGLAPYDGHAMSTWRAKGGLSADEWTSAGYSPRRRAEIYACVGVSLAFCQLRSAGKSGTEYGEPLGPYGEA